MKLELHWWLIVFFFLAGCKEDRVYDNNLNIKDFWSSKDTLYFDFKITDNRTPYNIQLFIRNTSKYKWARFFVGYQLVDSVDNKLYEKLTQNFLFDQASGKPFGKSGIGDIFEHQFIIQNNYQFPANGQYKIKLNQMMRTDSLKGILSAGIRIERVPEKPR